MSIRVRVRVMITQLPEREDSKIYLGEVGKCNKYIRKEWVESTAKTRI